MFYVRYEKRNEDSLSRSSVQRDSNVAAAGKTLAGGKFANDS